MNIARIDVTFRPRMPDPVPGMRFDPGGHIYQIFNANGSKHMGGSIGTLDQAAAWRYACDTARKVGYTHYRSSQSLSVVTAL